MTEMTLDMYIVGYGQQNLKIYALKKTGFY